MDVNLEKLGKETWRRLGNPILGVLGVVLFLTLVVGSKVRADLWLQFEHLIGIVLVVIGAVLAILLACYFLFDSFLSFREFAQAIHKWEEDRKAGKETSLADALVILSMAVRSGLVFAGISIIVSGTLLYLDFGGTV